jgi:K+-transporting ATPase ATPase C chain
MLLHLKRSIIISLIFLVLLGLVYPLVGTGVSQLLFKYQANGSITTNGSALIGQNWTGPKWFQGRPSATSPDPYNAMASAQADYGPRSKLLESAVEAQAKLLEKEGIAPTNGLVTSSGSGLDPDIAPADAYTQVSAVAKAQGLPVAEVKKLVTSQIHGLQFGFLGASYVNVLSLNNALSKLSS